MRTHIRRLFVTTKVGPTVRVRAIHRSEFIMPCGQDVREFKSLWQGEIVAILVQASTKDGDIDRYEDSLVSHACSPTQHSYSKSALSITDGAPSALSRSCLVSFRSRTTQICMMYGLPFACSLTSSSEVFEYDERHIATPILAAAREVASSPSGCASCCIAEGLMPNGNDVYRQNAVSIGCPDEMELWRIILCNP